MCDPMLLMAAATAVSTFSAVQQGKDTKAAAKFNAREAENSATQLRNQGTEKENALRGKNARLLSKQRAQFAAGNVNIDSGSALQIQEDTKLYGEIDALRLRSNVSNEADSMDRGAQLTLSEGAAAGRAANIRAAGTALSGAGKVADKWYTPGSSANQDFGGGDYVGDVNKQSSYGSGVRNA